MDLTQILEAVISLAIIIISTVLIPWLKSKYSIEQMNTLQAWVNIAVQAAEQIFDSGTGTAKKQYVLTFLQAKGFKVNTDEVSNMIESAVLELTNSLTKK